MFEEKEMKEAKNREGTKKESERSKEIQQSRVALSPHWGW
jgi:hypothetical protein